MVPLALKSRAKKRRYMNGVSSRPYDSESSVGCVRLLSSSCCLSHNWERDIFGFDATEFMKLIQGIGTSHTLCTVKKFIPLTPMSSSPGMPIATLETLVDVRRVYLDPHKYVDVPINPDYKILHIPFSGWKCNC